MTVITTVLQQVFDSATVNGGRNGVQQARVM